jgi:L-fuculose-phosphate aldolase
MHVQRGKLLLTLQPYTIARDMVKMSRTVESTVSARTGRARRDIVRYGRKLAELGFHAALAGNISARIAEDRLLCTSTGSDKGELQNDDLVVCNLDGKLLEGEARPTSEILMHLSVYRARPDVQAVIHAHPPTATAFAAASEPLNSLYLPEMFVWLGPIALVPYGTPGTPALSAQLEPYLAKHDGFLLENHGALAVGKSLRETAQRMELIEQNARITLMTRLLARTPFVLAGEQLDTLLALRSRLRQVKS